ncbi:hypothetical protein EDL98_05365 [Ornithobacterium rhinotracheale]|uniref:hypothetical protein n=1 Tax=Ornithobacterium rhinotracheale TaxID=28251 RepID=UPI00129CCD3F|nr:hypothetical protein [Ornithobacterium rhinotracheale]MRJ10509.1 hypothetical protein [Ornithobacterium rhinotracheale]
MSNEVTNQKDYAYVFEKIVKKVWGRPKTDVYFSNFYDSGNPEFKYILFSICVYLINYKGELLSDDEKNRIEEYTENFIENLENYNYHIKIIDFLGDKFNIN